MIYTIFLIPIALIIYFIFDCVISSKKERFVKESLKSKEIDLNIDGIEFVQNFGDYHQVVIKDESLMDNPKELLRIAIENKLYFAPDRFQKIVFKILSE